jgi:hypothetical protein
MQIAGVPPRITLRKFININPTSLKCHGIIFLTSLGEAAREGVHNTPTSGPIRSGVK